MEHRIFLIACWLLILQVSAHRVVFSVNDGIVDKNSFDSVWDELHKADPEGDYIMLRFAPVDKIIDNEDKSLYIRYDVKPPANTAKDLRIAQLELYKKPVHDTETKSFIFSIYQRILEDNEKWNQLLVYRKEVSAQYEGSIIADVTDSVDFWIKNPDKNYGFKVVVEMDDSKSDVVQVEDAGISGEALKGKPYIVGYFKNQGLA